MKRRPGPWLDFQHLSIVRAGRRVLQDLSLTIHAGESIALLGPNGSGKSTLIKMITRELYPLQDPRATFEIFGGSFWDVADLRRRLGIVSTEVRPFQVREVTGQDAVLSGFFSSVGLWPHHRVTATQRKKMREVLKFLEIEALAERPMSAMSSGEAQRFLIGRALVHDPEALILDEPTNSLDLHAAAEFRRILSKIVRRGKSILLVTHHVEDIIPEIRRVLLLKGGRVLYDGAKTTALTSARLSQVFGLRLRVQLKNGFCHALPSRRPSRS